MKTLSFTFILVLSLSFAACTSSDSKNEDAEQETMARLIDLQDFFKNPEKSSYNISPNGEYFAYMAPYEKRMNIHVQKVGDSTVQLITKETDRDIAGYFWATDNRIIYLKDDAGDENFALYGVNRDGKELKKLTKDGVKVQIIDDLEEIPEFMIIGTNERNEQIFDAYRLNINTGASEMIAQNPGNIGSWMTDHDGKLRLAITTDGVNSSILYRETEADEFKTVITTNFKESFNPQFFEFDNSPILYGTSNMGRDKSALVKFDLSTGKEVEELYKDDENDIGGATYSKKRKVITSVRWYGQKAERHFFDEEAKAIYADLEEKLPGVEVAVSSVNKNEDKFIIRTYSDKSRGAYYYYEKESKKLEKIDDVSPWINEDEMADMQPITYTSRDGLTIHGYLTLPKGVKAKNLPVVINPHGGPWARDFWGFNPEVQFLANRGYAVLQMNFRGSTSYGREFWEKSFKQWGQTMQDDITDGVEWLKEQGVADPERIAIYGGSYGGYATLAGLTYTPNLYACGVDYVGVSNLFTFMETIPPYWTPYIAMLHEMVGDPEQDSAMLAQYSPSLNADKIVAPLFIAQGANDPRVKKSESDQMVEAMKERGVDVQYMVKDDEGHGFRNEENRFDFYEAMESFLEKHLNAAEEVSASAE
ncbi:S9 family peptidase [bacterium]|nr:S9 family peptidase [bacterium]